MAKNDGAPQRVTRSFRPAREPGWIEFKAAVLEFSEAPTEATLVRYLNASRALDGLDPRRRLSACVGAQPAPPGLPAR